MPYFNFSEAVAGVVGRADILAAVFFLLALLAFSKHLQVRDKRPSVTSSFANKTNHPNDYECDRNGNFAAASKKLAVYGKGQQSLSSSSTFLVLEPYLLLTVIFSACAMFSKEQGITVLGMHLDIFQLKTEFFNFVLYLHRSMFYYGYCQKGQNDLPTEEDFNQPHDGYFRPFGLAWTIDGFQSSQVCQS